MKKTQNDHDVPPFASELHWLAFCYVAGEMTAEQTTLFEQRLAEDFEAQVAVADAVLLSSSTHASIETSQNRKVLVDRSHHCAANRSSLWLWVAIAAGLLVLVSSWQLLRNMPDNRGLAVKSTALDRQLTNSAIGLNELELWDRTVEIYSLGNVHDDESEIYSNSSVSDSLDGDYDSGDVNSDGDSEEIADALLVDSDLTSIFASAISSLDLSKGGL